MTAIYETWRPVKASVEAFSTLLVGVGLTLSLAACGAAPKSAPEPEMDLWLAQVDWHRIEATRSGDGARGWARGVGMAAGGRLEVPSGADTNTTGALSNEGYLDTLIYPLPNGTGSTPGEVVLTSRAGVERERVSLDGPSRVAWSVSSGDQLVASGPAVLVRAKMRFGPRNEEDRRRRLLIVGDTLRADYAQPERMPNLNTWFSRGIRFQAAFAPSSWTLPSMASMITGKPTASLRHPDGTLISLAEEEVTIAERLNASGYATIGATANFTVNHENGFSQGFDLFFAPLVAEGESAEAPDAAWLASRAEEAYRWFGDGPSFVYLHFMEPHEPYRHHESGQVVGSKPSYVGATDSEIAAMVEAYGSEVRYLDRAVGAILEQYAPFELAVFTADHGEEFGERGGLRHGPTLHSQVVHVPLLVSGELTRDSGLGAIEEPYSLLHLSELVTGNGIERDELAGVPRMETWSHTAPRWAQVEELKSDSGGSLLRQIRLTSRWYPPPETTDPMVAWLAATQPAYAVEFLSAESKEGPSTRTESLDPGWLLDVAETYESQRRGVWLLAGDAAEGTLEIDFQAGLVAPVIVWGDGEVTTSTGAAGLSWHARGPGLLFAPFGRDHEVPENVEVEGQLVKLLPSAPSASVEGAAITAWWDDGRPAVELRGVEETLERLRALGYIE